MTNDPGNLSLAIFLSYLIESCMQYHASKDSKSLGELQVMHQQFNYSMQYAPLIPICIEEQQNGLTC